MTTGGEPINDLDLLDTLDDLGIAQERLAYGLALYPPAEIQQRLRRDLHARGIPYPHRFHVTLKYAFIPTDGSLCGVATLARLIGRYPPLRLRSHGRLESDGTLCHLLLLEQHPPLMRLHGEVEALLGPAGRLLSPDTGRFEGSGFNPHITIAYGSTLEEFRSYGALLEGFEPALEFEVRGIELSCFEPGRADPIRSAARVFPLARIIHEPAHPEPVKGRAGGTAPGSTGSP